MTVKQPTGTKKEEIPEDLVLSLHAHTTANKETIQSGVFCLCFYCCSIYKAKDVKEFIGLTAICPKCGIDSVLPDSVLPAKSRQMVESLYKLLESMYRHWFTQ